MARVTLTLEFRFLIIFLRNISWVVRWVLIESITFYVASSKNPLNICMFLYFFYNSRFFQTKTSKICLELDCKILSTGNAFRPSSHFVSCHDASYQKLFISHFFFIFVISLYLGRKSLFTFNCPERPFLLLWE